MRDRNFLMVVFLFFTSGVHAADGLPSLTVRVQGPGAPAILIDGIPELPIFFAGNNQFGKDEVLLSEMQQADEAGTRIFTFNLPAPLGDVDAVTKCVAMFASATRGRFLVRIWLGADEAWRAAHPNELIRDEDGKPMDYASPASTLWRDEMSARLRAAIQAIKNGPHASRLLGFVLTYLQTGEWFYPETERYLDYSAPNQAAFRNWLAAHYSNDAALRQAWGVGDATLERATIPTPEAREASAWAPFRDPVRGRAARDYARFTSEHLAEVFAEFARVAKEATDGRSLVGAFYGYTFELNHNGPRALQHSGHTALAKLLDTPDIDFIAAPYSYLDRGPGQSCHFHFPVDSISLHGKLAIIEDDTFTDASHAPPGGDLSPGNSARTTTQEQTVNVAARNFGQVFGHGCGQWWFDLFCDGRWSAPSFWESTRVLRELATRNRGAENTHPEVAFVVDEVALACLRDTTHPELEQALGFARGDFDRLGAPVGYYLQSDLAKLPEVVKVIYLATPFDVADDVATQLERQLQRGRTVIWGWMPGQCGQATLNLERIKALTGFEAAMVSDLQAASVVKDLDGEVLDLGRPTGPMLAIAGDDVVVLERYEPTGAVACASMLHDGGRSVFTSLPRMTWGTLRRICAAAGVHLYTNLPALVSRVGQDLFVTPQTKPGQSVEITLTFEKDAQALEVLRLPSASIPLSGETSIVQSLAGGETAIYRLGSDHR